MYSPIENTFTKSSHHNPTTTKKMPTSLPTEQLGGGGGGGGRGENKIRQVLILAKFIGRVKVKCMLKKVKNYSVSLVKEIKESGKALESMKQQLVISVPVMGLSINSYPINKSTSTTK